MSGWLPPLAACAQLENEGPTTSDGRPLSRGLRAVECRKHRSVGLYIEMVVVHPGWVQRRPVS